MLLGLIGLPQTTGAVRRQHRCGQPKYEAYATSKNQTQKSQNNFQEIMYLFQLSWSNRKVKKKFDK